jgi:hypothetical protein
MPTELMQRFSRKQWKGCCGSGCKKCAIAQAYIGEYGKKKGLDLLNEDREAAKKGKAVKKGDGKAKKGDGKAKKGDGKGVKGKKK